MNKQIEDLGKKLRAYTYDMKLNDNDDCQNVADFIINTLGYRKTEDIAREIFAEIEKCLHTVNYPFINADGCLTPIQAPYLAIYPNDFAELKKKYESEGTNGNL